MNEVEQCSCRSAVTSRAGGKLFSGTISRKVDGRATVAPTPRARPHSPPQNLRLTNHLLTCSLQNIYSYNRKEIV